MKWRIVPSSSTEEMANAVDYGDLAEEEPKEGKFACQHSIYTAMLAASPSPVEDAELVNEIANMIVNGYESASVEVARSILKLLYE